MAHPTTTQPRRGRPRRPTWPGIPTPVTDYGRDATRRYREITNTKEQPIADDDNN
jgi:hypothetical protein